MISMIYILMAIGIFLGDRSIKSYIEKNKELGEEESVCKDTIIITKCYNKGVFLNCFEKKTSIVIAISGVLIGILVATFAMLLPQRRKKLLKLGIALLTGGAFSNLADRIEKGYVVDYFSFHVKKENVLQKINKVVFNIGDMAIFLGSILLVIHSFFHESK